MLEVCAKIPDLRELNLAWSNLGKGSTVDAFEALAELTLSPATARIEKFSKMDIYSHFSGEFGQIFKSWKNLKVLQLGDEDNGGGPFGQYGRLKFEDYRPVSTSSFFIHGISANKYPAHLSLHQKCPPISSRTLP